MPNTREKLIELLGGVQSYGVKHTYEETASSMGFRENDEVADHLIANGVTIPVRCKECEHYTPLEAGKPLCALHSIAVAQDDFCSYGERRNDV